ncbi:MAG TPA: recombinase family protein [Burkholderiales bacterium]|jgi:DNA invertase Pin-like site-specific DNA recombinase
MAKTIGYARVSSKDQKLSLQRDALAKEGCGRVFAEKKSGRSMERAALQEAVGLLDPGDRLVVWRLDRLGRCAPEIISMGRTLHEKKIKLDTATQTFDNGTAIGRLIFGIQALFDEYESENISMRTRAGMAAAKRRGKELGRPRVMSERQVSRACSLADKSVSVRKIAARLRKSKSTVHRRLREANA